MSVSPELPVRVQEPFRSEELWSGPGEWVHVGRPLERNHHCPGGDDPVPEPYWRQDPVGDALNDNLGKFIEKNSSFTYLGSDRPDPLHLHDGGPEQVQLVLQGRGLVPALGGYLRLYPLLQPPALVTGQEHEGEQDGVGAGLRARAVQVALEEVHLPPGKASHILPPPPDLLKIEVSETFRRVSLRQEMLSLSC